MNHIDQLYLQIIYNTCVQNPTDFITIQPENEQPLTELTKWCNPHSRFFFPI